MQLRVRLRCRIHGRAECRRSRKRRGTGPRGLPVCSLKPRDPRGARLPPAVRPAPHCFGPGLSAQPALVLHVSQGPSMTGREKLCATARQAEPVRRGRHAAAETSVRDGRPTRRRCRAAREGSRKARADLRQAGPAAVGRSDLLPPAYIDALSRLQDDVKPFPFAEVERIVEAELGVRISKAFGLFEKEPLAAASLGQVHRGGAARRTAGRGEGAAARARRSRSSKT